MSGRQTVRQPDDSRGEDLPTPAGPEPVLPVRRDYQLFAAVVSETQFLDEAAHG